MKKHTVHIGNMADWKTGSYSVPVFVTITLIDAGDGRRKLSITGVEGPKANGDAEGSCGQTIMSEWDYLPSTGWNAEMMDRLRDYWDRWHMNDMRAGCEHQRERWAKPVQVERHRFVLNHETLAAQRELRRRIDKEVAATGSMTPLTAEEKHLHNLRYDEWSHDANPPEHYEYKESEKKYSNWYSPAEHPKGILCKPCEVCGYRYGTQWLYEEVPQEVIDWLFALPVGDKKIPERWAR